jgi:glycosyltransferase involved in cell wall biosynthesis
MKGIKCPVIFEANGINAEDIIQNADKYLDNVKNIFDDDKIHLLCIARLEPVKRIEKVFEAVEFLLSNNIRINCVIAGKGRLENRLKNQIRRKKLESCISIVYSPYIHSIIKKADIVVLTSEKEGIPRSLMEAMALKKPVVATDVLGTNELVLHNDTGYLVSIDDQEDFNRLLLKLIDDPGLRVRFGEAGYKRVVEEFSDEKIVDLWVEWYLRLMGSRT